MGRLRNCSLPTKRCERIGPPADPPAAAPWCRCSRNRARPLVLAGHATPTVDQPLARCRFLDHDAQRAHDAQRGAAVAAIQVIAHVADALGNGAKQQRPVGDGFVGGNGGVAPKGPGEMMRVDIGGGRKSEVGGRRSVGAEHFLPFLSGSQKVGDRKPESIIWCEN